MTASSFPEFITARRRELELTLGDVASSLGVSPITVSNWSNGDSTPKPENLVALAELLEFPADELADMAGVTLKSAAEGVNLMPTPEVVDTDTAEADEAEVEETVEVAEAAELPPAEPIELQDLSEPESMDEPDVEIPVEEPESELEVEEPESELEVEEPESELEVEEPESELEVEEPESELEVEEPESIVEDEVAPDSVPAFVAAEAPAAEKAPAEKRRPVLRRPRTATAAAAERQVTTLPLTYIEDPKQLMRYRIRWALTVVILLIMFIVLLWASRELLSALSEVKQSVTPGGIGNG